MGEEAEKKYLASLDFDIAKGNKSLEELTKELNTLANNSEKLFEKMSKNMKSAFNIDTSDLSKSAKASVEKSLAQAEKYKAQAEKYEKQITKIKEEEAEKRVTITHRENEKIRRDHEKNEQEMTEATKKGVTDRISEYAKTYIIYQGFNQLKQAAIDTVNEMVRVESQMVSIERVMEEGSIQIDKYRDELIKLAYQYGNSFDNVADITLRLAQAGFDANEALALTEKTLLALNTADLDATEATSDMVAVMAQWGLMTGNATQEAEDYASIIDKINKVADNFPTTSADIMDALKKTSSAFNLAGASIDETIATIVAAEKASQRGGKAIGTALSNITQQLKDTKRMATAEGLGINFYTDETKTEYKSLMEIFEQLSEKMQQLKADGKESSVEMQELLNIFTVFRRNVGASLLGEMAGETSTYAQVLETSINSIGYSVSENEKYMRTAEAAQKQFNATLLELKTAVWDNGLSDVFRSMMLIGGDVANVFKFLINTFGTLPTTIGVCVLALSTFNKNLKFVQFNAKDLKLEMNGTIKEIVIMRNVLKDYKAGLISADVANQTLAKAGIPAADAALLLQKGIMKTTTVTTLELKAATIALNAAMSIGLSLAITAVISLFDNLIHAQEKASEKIKETNDYWREAADASKQRAEDYRNEADTLSDLIKEYDKIAQSGTISDENLTRVLEIQSKIKSVAGDTASAIDLQNGKYEEQIQLLNKINTQQMTKALQEQKDALADIRKEVNNYLIDVPKEVALSFEDMQDKFREVFDWKDAGGLLELFSASNITDAIKDWINNFDELDIEGRIEKLEELKSKLELEGDINTEAYNWVKDSLKTLRTEQEKLNTASDEYYNNLAKLKIQEWFLDGDKIKTVEDFRDALDLISKMPLENIDGFEERLVSILNSIFPQFSAETQVITGNVEQLNSAMSGHIDQLVNLESKYAQLTAAQEEYNNAGQLSLTTMKDLINNDLLQYLSFQDGQLRINTQSFLDLAEAEKVSTINLLQNAAQADIQKAAMGDVKNMSGLAQQAIAGVGNASETAKYQMQDATVAAAQLGAALYQTKKLAEGELGEGVDASTFNAQANAIIGAYQGIANQIASMTITGGSYTPSTYSRSSGSSSGGSSSAATNAAKREAEQAAKDAENARKAIVKAFENAITERERLEQRFVKNKKALGLLSDEDEKYILQESIKRYRKYADEVLQLTMATEEEKAELRQKYLEKAEDLEVEYIKLLNDLLDDQIDEIEDKYKDDVDNYKDAVDEKIDAIKKQAQAEIDALNAVEDENERIRKKEEYEAKRKELVSGYQGVEYWQQRSGREAQLALAEAKQKVADLDKDWQETLEGWAKDDQIALIEQRRDADIAATEAEREAYLLALEDTKNAEIKALQDKYDYQVEHFNKTGEIIADNAKIQSEEMFRIYKENFVDPIGSELQSALSSGTTSTTTTAQVATPSTIDYTIQWGDTLTSIAARYNTTIDKLLQANPYITDRNLIYAGRNLKIPTSHTGSRIIKDGLVELQAGEVVLNMQWAKGLDKMLGEFNKSNATNNTINKSNTINVNGSLIDFDATIDDNVDVAFITKKITRELSQKFNIK